LGLEPGKVLVLPNAVPDPRPASTAREPGAQCHFLFLGYLSARKGVPELLQALAHPALRSLPWRATLAGGGPVDEYRQQAAALGIGERVRFPGWLEKPQVDQLCGDADVLVLPSYAEGLAMSALEGLSHGLAVITTPVGAHPEVIEPGISGIFVPPGDAEALAAALQSMIENPRLRQQLQQGARARYVEKFDIAGYARRLGHIHEAVLLGPQAR
jgi:glycosyltransferase involved in cell wall biosynthesis